MKTAVRSGNRNELSTDEAPKAFACNLCPRSYSRYVRLQQHSKSHTSESTKCTSCQKVFASRRGLKVHMQTHQAHLKLTCPLCPVSYLAEQSFRKCLVVEHKFTTQNSRKKATELMRKLKDRSGAVDVKKSAPKMRRTKKSDK